MHTCNSLVFTVTSLVGLMIINDWRVLVVAFALSAGVGLFPAIPTLFAWTNVEPSLQPAVPYRKMWKRVLPYAISVWCMNLLVNLFDVVDRYMLLYLAADSAEFSDGQSVSQDRDGDGVANGVEYFMGANNSQFTANPQIVGSLISWPRNPFATGVSFKVWSSDNLSTWTNVTNNADISNPNFVKYSVLPGDPKRFVRLEVSAP